MAQKNQLNPNGNSASAASADESEIIAVDANFEQVTILVHRYRHTVVYPKIAQHGFKMDVLDGDLTVRQQVSQKLPNSQLRFLTGSGHGERNVFKGKNFERLLEVNNYQSAEVSGKIIHLLSCKVAVELGVDLVRNGCRAFFGYNENFAYLPQVADDILECDAEIDYAIAEGETAERAYQRTVSVFNQKIEFFDNQPDTDETGRIVAILEINRDALCAPSIDSKWGDLNASL